MQVVRLHQGEVEDRANTTVADGLLRLRLAALGAVGAPMGILSNEAPMAQAAFPGRARGRGRLSLEDDAVTFLLPIAGP